MKNRNNVEIKSLNVEKLDVNELEQQLEELQSYQADKCPKRSG